jgi:DNA-binding NarL/FixJ family response regulator
MDDHASRDPVRMFLIGLQNGMARALGEYIGSDPRVALTGAAPSIEAALSLLPPTRPDIALLDWPAIAGASRESVAALRRCAPGLRIACTTEEPGIYADSASRFGADAVVSRRNLAVELDLLLRANFPGRYG